MQNIRGNSFEIMRNLNWPETKLSGMIIQVQAASFERIQNVQMQAFQTLFICLLLLPFSCVFFFFSFFFFFSSLIQPLPTSCCLQWRNARFCNVFFGVTSCYRKSLCEMPSALLTLEHFLFIELWTKCFKQWNCRKTNVHKKKKKLLCLIVNRELGDHLWNAFTTGI